MRRQKEAQDIQSRIQQGPVDEELELVTRMSLESYQREQNLRLSRTAPEFICQLCSCPFSNVEDLQRHYNTSCV